VERLAEQACERRGVAGGGPQLELRVAARAHLEQRVFAPVVQFKSRDDLGVAAVEAFSQAEYGGKGANGSPVTAAETGVLVVMTVGCRSPVIPRHEGDGVDLVRLEAAQVAVLDQVVGVFVVTLV